MNSPTKKNLRADLWSHQIILKFILSRLMWTQALSPDEEIFQQPENSPSQWGCAHNSFIIIHSASFHHQSTFCCSSSCFCAAAAASSLTLCPSNSVRNSPGFGGISGILWQKQNKTNINHSYLNMQKHTTSMFWCQRILRKDTNQQEEYIKTQNNKKHTHTHSVDLLTRSGI